MKEMEMQTGIPFQHVLNLPKNQPTLVLTPVARPHPWRHAGCNREESVPAPH